MTEMFKQLTSAIDRRHRSFFAASGDARQVWALNTTTGRVDYLPEDGVDENVRRACEQEHLRCPMRDCPDPRFSAKGGTVRRHHFAHKVAHTKHSTAAVYRAEAVAMLAQWARRYSGAEITTSDAEQLGTVAIRSTKTGKVLKLGVTYNRSYDYWAKQASDLHDQLLIGHTRGLLLPREEHPDEPGVWCCGDPQLVGAIILLHHVAIAINPQERLVATLINATVARRAGLIPMSVTERPNVCIVVDINDCSLDETGLVTPTLDRLREWQHQEEARRSAAPRPDRRPPPTPAHETPWRPAEPPRKDPREEEYQRRARGLSTDDRLALIKEIFLKDKLQ